MTLTIIIPVYNVLPYLRKCLDSVLAAVSKALDSRSENLFEVICVDDGATDGSSSVLDEYSDKLMRNSSLPNLTFQVIHQKNGGVSVARNIAIDNATGEWLHFIDADDWIGEDLYEKLFKELSLNSDADAVAFAATKMDESGNVHKILCGDARMANMTGDALLGDPQYLSFSGCIWNKIYRREIVNREKLRFLVGMQPAEDDLFNILYLTYASKVVVVPMISDYFYRATPGSSVHTMNVKKLIFQVDEFEGLYERWCAVRTIGLTAIIVIVAKRLVCLGAQTGIRQECIDFLVDSEIFKRKVLPFLVRFGDFQSKLFAMIYLLIPIRELRRRILQLAAR